MPGVGVRFFATAPSGVAALLAGELRALGAQSVVERPAGATFSGDLEAAYRACLWSRTAARVLLPLTEFAADDADAIYAAARDVAWEEHLAPEGTLAVECAAAPGTAIHTRFAALRVKDAVADRFRALRGVRPSVDVERPDLRIHLHLRKGWATVSIDLSGTGLHRRGYRGSGMAAPLKENLAAAILLRAGWPETAAAGGALVDPMCGSGTLPIEAAMIAADVAPGLLRPYYGFLGWAGHDARLWERLLAEARERRAAGRARLPAIVGYDADAAAVRAAIDNVERAELRGCVHIERRALSACEAPRGAGPGLVVVNPPYGRRLGTPARLGPLYAELGALLRRRFPDWRAAVFTADTELARRIGRRAQRVHTLYNGPIECRLLQFAAAPPGPGPTASAAGGEGAEMFANRLHKNLKRLERWARREGVHCYRLYDADLPEYAVAVDLYAGAAGRWAHVQEYQAPASVDPAKAGVRLQDALAAIRAVLELPDGALFLKVRRRRKGREQYEKLDASGRFETVEEGGLRFLVNFSDYLDTGLFLDHRPTRALIRAAAKGARFLNLFGYTGAASVYAAAGGAARTVTVDLSHTYLDWARRNLELNGCTGPRHRLVHADCLEWLRRPDPPGPYDLIFLDPPTFSASKRMRATFDVQRDHAALIRDAVRLLAPGGALLFSCNLRRFRLDTEVLADLRIEDLTRATIPPDFARNPRIHQCWRISKASPKGTDLFERLLK